MSLFDEAENIGNNDAGLRNRLTIARGCLRTPFRAMFNPGKFKLAEKRLYSNDGLHALEWVNDGNSSIGSVRCIVIRPMLGS